MEKAVGKDPASSATLARARKERVKIAARKENTRATKGPGTRRPRTGPRARRPQGTSDGRLSGKIRREQKAQFGFNYKLE